MSSRKRFLAVLLVMIVVSVCFIVLFNVPAQSVNAEANQAWLSGWNYRKLHKIQGSLGAGTDYQIQLTVHYQKGTDSGSNVYLDYKCQPNFADVRFTDNNGLTLLNYWIENKVDSDYAVFWVKINDNLDSNQTIYIYYGNSTIASASNMQETFPFADDFSGSSLNTSMWRTFGNGQLTVANGVCTLESVAGDGGWIYLYGRSQFGINYAIRFSSLVIEQGSLRWTHHGFGTIYNDSDKSGGRIDEYPNFITASQEAQYYAWSLRTRAFQNTSRLDLSNQAPAVNTYYTYEIQRNGTTNAILTCNDVVEGSLNTNLPTVNMGAMFGTDNAGSTLYSVTAIDWVVIHKYVANEPLQGAWGNAESILPSNIFGIQINQP